MAARLRNDLKLSVQLRNDGDLIFKTIQ
jgi:hypothetical protein